MKTNTSIVQAGQNFEPSTRAIIPPPYLTSTFVQERPGVSKYEYGRTDNPSFRNLEKALTAIEKDAVDAVVFNSGTSAINAIINLLSPGDTLLCDTNTYSGTRRLFLECFKKFGIQTVFCDASDLKKFEDAVSENTKLIWIETPTNPLLKINDIQELAKIAKKNSILFCVDSTFATPINQSPLELGASLVVYSTTKYISGHSDLIGGAITSNNQKLIDKIRWLRNALGLNPSAFDCWLAQRGLKTLAVRMQRHQENAMKLAEWFQEQSFVEKATYPGLPSHPQYGIVQKQMKGYSGVVSVVFDLNSDAIEKFLMNLKIWQIAESLGGVESLVDYPWLMTQSGLSEDDRKKSKISPGLVRFSTGIEDIEDLMEDIKQALERAGVCPAKRPNKIAPTTQTVKS